MSKLNPTFFGKVGEDGKFRFNPNDRKLFDLFVASYPAESDLVIQVRKFRRQRSNDQNAYYWGVVIPIIQEAIGNLRERETHADIQDAVGASTAGLENIVDPEDVHDILKFQFLRSYVAGVFERVKSTTDLDTLAFEDYLSRVRTWATQELGVFIPLPNESEEWLNSGGYNS